MINLRKNVSLAKYTTLGIGGCAKYFVEIESKDQLVEAIDFAQRQKLEYLIIGGGSDLLVSDGEYSGFVIKNNIKGISFSGLEVRIGSGENLDGFVQKNISNGLSGLESMSAIPGTVGGAIYGNAGAYGQSISDHLVGVEVFDGKKVFWMKKTECEFGYRESIFKRNKYLILAAKFKFTRGKSDELAAKRKEILEVRLKKYPMGLKCPGSFFKNVEVSKLSKSQLSKIPIEKIVYGKIPSGYLLEEIGAKGKVLGKIKVADYHANLFINTGGGTARDFLALSNKFKKKVKEKFGIELEPEVQLVGF